MGAASLHNEAHANRPVHIYIYIVDSVVTLLAGHAVEVIMTIALQLCSSSGLVGAHKST